MTLDSDFGDGPMPNAPITNKKAWSQNVDMRVGNPSAGRVNPDLGKNPQMMTVQFSLIKFPLAPATGLAEPFDCEAEIVFKVEGGQTPRRISVVDGATISGPGGSIDVTLRDVTTQIVTQDREYTVQISISTGVRASNGQPPVLKGDIISNIAPGANVLVDIPQGAGVRSVWVSAVGAAVTPANKNPEVQIFFVEQGGGGNPYGFFEADATGGSFVPIPPNANQMLVYNVDAAKDASVWYIWGIDG